MKTQRLPESYSGPVLYQRTGDFGGSLLPPLDAGATPLPAPFAAVRLPPLTASLPFSGVDTAFSASSFLSRPITDALSPPCFSFVVGGGTCCFFGVDLSLVLCESLPDRAASFWPFRDSAPPFSCGVPACPRCGAGLCTGGCPSFAVIRQILWYQRVIK